MHATPHINTNIARDFVLTTPKKPKSINSADNMDGGSVPLGSSLILFKHQAMDLEWLLEREKAGQGGSILAHEMGLGKTITSIALIRKTLQEWKAVDLKNLTVLPSSRTRGSGKAPLARPKTTL
ncbi:uncharacterized protein EDB91DRAFT_1346687 [Suillus paluster]|uniref:uncharacterized protein n=1 Tax=Suillus paluster TaxID=48578 RepID=UPI001B875659|nr:uncharacterized protein EDB91DRAFT_1346687 [Suillus paluster]KAG1741804.1 hypothetical protein EDB91DRAFT_1346687 [Suillus paluster]